MESSGAGGGYWAGGAGGGTGGPLARGFGGGFGGKAIPPGAAAANRPTKIIGNAWQNPYHNDKHSCKQISVPVLGIHTDVFRLI